MNLEETVPNTRLRIARHLKGWTQSELAAAIGTSFETVSRWERGITFPNPYFRVQLCAILGQTAQELGLNTPAPSSQHAVFLASAHVDTGNEVIASIRTGLQMHGIALWSSHLLKRQQEDDSKKVLREIMRDVYLVLLVASPHTRSSRNVNEALRVAHLYQRPICILWVEGEFLHNCIPATCNKSTPTIDARKGYHHLALAQIIALCEHEEFPATKKLGLVPAAGTTTMPADQAQSRCPYEELYTLLLHHATFFAHDQRINDLLAHLKTLLTE